MTYFITITLTLSTIFFFFLGCVANQDMTEDIKEALPAFIVSVVMTLLSLISLIFMVVEYV